MATIPTPHDFIAFLKLLNENNVKYLLVGGYAVGFHGYVRATGHLDVWVSISARNANQIVKAIKQFGFKTPDLKTQLFLKPDSIIRMGKSPIRIEVITTISGVNFSECYNECVIQNWNGIEVPVLGLKYLIKNKKASGRLKDLTDVEQLEKLL